MPSARMDFNLGNSTSGKLCPKSSSDSRWTSARTRTLDPQAQVAGSLAKRSTLFSAPQTLQMKETTKLCFTTSRPGGPGPLE